MRRVPECPPTARRRSAPCRPRPAAGGGRGTDPRAGAAVRREAAHRGVALVRAYAHSDAPAVSSLLGGLDPAARDELRLVVREMLGIVVGTVLSAPRSFTPADVVRTADRIAAAAPAGHRPMVAETIRSWARGDHAPLRTLMREGPGALHAGAVFTTSLALTSWGETPLHELLDAFEALPGGGDADRPSDADRQTGPDQRVDTDRPMSADRRVDTDRPMDRDQSVDADRPSDAGLAADRDRPSPASVSADGEP
ncbi:hypothetical protein [Streptomyces sp. NPDC014894]|uniref:hypothetical protein n=1 Tax=Streptomyces sp. NPDC014894 TaxID=3364931 RepID=UPI0036F6E8B0